MKTSNIITITIFFIFLFLGALIIFLQKREAKEAKTNLIEGKCYLYSHNWDNKNPYIDIEIDTIQVMKISDDKKYIQYKVFFKDTFFVNSTTIEILQYNAKYIKNQ